MSKRMTNRKPFERLNETRNDGSYVIIGGEKVSPYWKDKGLMSRYKNCSDFLNQVVQKFSHIETLIKLKSKDAEREKIEFKKWLGQELRYPELRKCFNNTERADITSLKEWLKSGLI